MSLTGSDAHGVLRNGPAWAHALSWVREVFMRYKVVLHRTDEGISVSVPGLPGCWSEGDTEDEALENIRDAIREYVAALADQARSEDVREVEVAV